MKKIFLLGVLVVLTSGIVTAQRSKRTPGSSHKPMPPASSVRLHWPNKTAVPEIESPFGLPAPVYRTLPVLQAIRPAQDNIRTVMGEAGLPISFEGITKASLPLTESGVPTDMALAYWAAIEPAAIQDAAAEFVTTRSHRDEQGNWHVRLEQRWQGLPVFGSEVIVHSREGRFQHANGRYFPTPSLTSVTPALTALEAENVVKSGLGADKIKTNWTAEELQLIGLTAPFVAELVIWHQGEQAQQERLVWMVRAYRDVLHSAVYFVDAMHGTLLDSYETTCKIAGHRHTALESEGEADGPDHLCAEAPLNGPVSANGLDLLNQNRMFGAWDINGVTLMIDGSQPMFNTSASVMPKEPVGAIVTLDGLNNNVEGDFRYKNVTTTGQTFNNKTAVSAHYNAIRSYDYFRTKHSRNSIDGVGGTIYSFINVADKDGSSMENAFWNGEAMFYGNGGTVFRPLARGLDVGAHEMTHGVIQATANLVYQNQSGALNESFADVFAVLIDNDDWKIGEDVVQPGVSPNNCLRDMQNPNNGSTGSSQWWQPQHVNEMYTGTQDNGGVHINSGVPNRAFYLFASNPTIGREKAEQVYYKALRDYLVKSSKFLDCRLAVVRAATDLYGAAVANVAAAAFDAVGITTGSSTNYLGNLAVNPGTDYILCSPTDYSRIDLANGNGTVLGAVYNGTIKSRPSMRDNGREFVFVNENGDIIAGTLVYNGTNITPQSEIISDKPIWANAALSKDGRYIAALRDTVENLIFVFDLITGISKVFELYNPTTSNDFDKSGGVLYADVLEFDYSNQYIMYDAYNEIPGADGSLISYWDIGFLQFRKDGQWASTTDPFISKLFSALPDRTSVGNPVFAKNAPYIVAFDFFTESEEQYDVLGVNTETGDYDAIIENNGTYGFPSYNRLDNAVIYEGKSSSNNYHIYRRPVDASKIKGAGNETQFISNHVWGVWFANGNRSLNVVAAENPGSLKNRLYAVPNPTNGQANINFQTKKGGAAHCMISNLTGQVLYQRTFEAQPGTNQFDVDLHSLPTGTYIVRVQTEEGYGMVKVVKI